MRTIDREANGSPRSQGPKLCLTKENNHILYLLRTEREPYLQGLTVENQKGTMRKKNPSYNSDFKKSIFDSHGKNLMA